MREIVCHALMDHSYRGLSELPTCQDLQRLLSRHTPELLAVGSLVTVCRYAVHAQWNARTGFPSLVVVEAAVWTCQEEVVSVKDSARCHRLEGLKNRG